MRLDQYVHTVMTGTECGGIGLNVIGQPINALMKNGIVLMTIYQRFNMIAIIHITAHAAGNMRDGIV